MVACDITLDDHIQLTIVDRDCTSIIISRLVNLRSKLSDFKRRLHLSKNDNKIYSLLRSFQFRCSGTLDLMAIIGKSKELTGIEILTRDSVYVVDTIAANRFVIFLVSEGDYTLDDSFWNEETSVGKLKRKGERGFSNVSIA